MRIDNAKINIIENRKWRGREREWLSLGMNSLLNVLESESGIGWFGIDGNRKEFVCWK